jgi:toxin ParE1/3/4
LQLGTSFVVATFRFSRRAKADVLSIAEYTLRTWGAEQATRYIDELETFRQMLADYPGLGRSCDSIRSGLRRMECGRHVVFFREDASGILVSRILHQRMLPARYVMDEEE